MDNRAYLKNPAIHYLPELQMVKSDYAGDPGSVPGLGRSHGELMAARQNSCLENPDDEGSWRATVHGVGHN